MSKEKIVHTLLQSQVAKLVCGSVAVYVIVAACSSGSGGGSSVPSADAQSGQCTCTVNDNVRVVTADSDPSRAVFGGGDLPSLSSAELGTGPFYLTDVHTAGSYFELGVVPASATCDGFSAFAEINTAQAAGPANHGLIGSRMFVGANEKLCARNTGYNTDTYRWSGFKPFGT